MAAASALAFLRASLRAFLAAIRSVLDRTGASAASATWGISNVMDVLDRTGASASVTWDIFKIDRWKFKIDRWKPQWKGKLSKLSELLATCWLVGTSNDLWQSGGREASLSSKSFR